jgi:hypothetical protein
MSRSIELTSRSILRTAGAPDRPIDTAGRLSLWIADVSAEAAHARFRAASPAAPRSIPREKSTDASGQSGDAT